MFAVIKSGGRQYKVTVGQTLEVNRLTVEDGAQIKIEEVLLISDADNATIGTPFINDTHVLATALRQARGKKLIVFKYKPKKRYRHRRGHRQELTILRIDDIVANGKSLISGEEPKAQETPTHDALVEPTTTTTTTTNEAPETESAPETGARTTRRRRTTNVEGTGSTEDTESTTEE